ncbi:twin-arginine translocase subunit TatC [Deinococcus maricopensis]|uniref:Sec-independent protein translocase protein TatC n=1 Tax=Deinococcus maricopensis (strain DSM 21211 / LMG 22137 / NRRL B-23946 / LB-34) TaxID=709986 RepID=E8U703_DEIML|nr:twin-arginine translocase subunit TatC [Deinococcus maricopensis]ADV66842.1 Sec-independent protein translocase, TatC subunit [Deinococcus maricopensis DSM 21211]
MAKDTTAPLLDHLEELRSRIIYALIFLVIGAGAAWTYRTQLIELLKEPLTHTQLYQSGKLQLVVMQLTDQFILSFNVALWGGLALALPFILHQVWLFIAPGLYPEERRWAAPFVMGAGLSFLAGGVFCYFVILPPMVKFLADFLGGQVAGMFNLSAYLSQIVTFLVAFGIFFELPILAVVLTKIGIVNHTLLGRARKVAFMAILVLAAVITPTPDPWNMMLVALPIYALYELGVVLSRMSAPREAATGALE